MGLHSKAPADASELCQTAAFQRSQGPLSTRDMLAHRKAGIGLEYDPVQSGWVRADVTDDFDLSARRIGWPSVKSVQTRDRGIVLRRWLLTDATQFRSLLDNPDVWRHLPNPYPGVISIDMAEDLIRLSQDETLHRVRAIVANDTAVGQVRLDFAGQDPELSYWLGQPFWRKGIGLRAVQSFVAECFQDDPKLDHMIARARPENTGSLRILEKAGFIPEGRSNAAPDWIILRCDRPI
ncbi:MAG: GNAT family N-acetyltransferase [Aestuariivita sp.]|uniref:GNAT family N-acetyltransferase n=1 Tax=Aestuariivita sp. TaxID=1872407 RepID=UPI003BAFB274